MKPGDLLDGRFHIDRLAGSGGAGIVYRGVDRDTGGLVAIKTVRSEGAADRRFQREAEMLAGLRHPGIVTYLGHGRFEDELYLAMEWLDGEDLGTRLEAAELTVDESVSIGRQVAAALAAAHRRGIVHRDVKPSNVFLAGWRTDAVKLLDFGIARRAGLATLTTSGMLVGTPMYMAPEQARGSSDLDARVDVYGLGALLFRCLAGRPPFAGDTVDEMIAHILGQTPPRLASLVPGVPRGLDALVASMLAKDPARRPADAAAVQAALADLDAEPAVADPALDSTLEAHPKASSIAVLSFIDLSAGADQGYLCDGIAEELINALTHVEGLRVAARSSSFRFRSTTADAREIGARLAVDAVLEGGVRRAGDRLRVTVQLVDVASGYQRWSHRFDGKLDDVFAIQDEIAGSVATALRGILTRKEKDAIRRPGTCAEAYGYFLRGRELQHSVSPTSYEAAQQMFQRAIDIDPGYAPAYAGLAQMHARYYEWGDGDETTLEAGDRASRKALELAPQLAESHVARGHVLKATGRFDEAEREFREAIAINPNSYDAHVMYARTLFQWGKIVDSVPVFRRAAELRPEDCQCPVLLAQTLRGLGRDDEARAAGREAIVRAERQLALDPTDARTLSLGCTSLFFDGQRDRAMDWATRALSAAPDDPAVWYNVACLHACAGETDRALFYLERTIGRGIGGREWTKHDPDFDSIRDDPRFQALLARLR